MARHLIRATNRPDIRKQRVHYRDIETWDLRNRRSPYTESSVQTLRNPNKFWIASLPTSVQNYEARVADKAFRSLKAPVKRLTGPDAPAPASHALEQAFMPSAEGIVSAVRGML